MDAGDVLGSVLKGALKSGRKKRRHRTRGYLTGSGSGSFLNVSTILGAVGVAWGMYEAMRAKTTVPGSAGGIPGLPGSGPPPGPLPPSAGSPASRSLELPTASPPAEIVRMIRLAISAARADATLADDEKAEILDRAREAGVESIVETELAHPRPLAEILAGAGDAAQKTELYTMAFAIVRADETVSGAERIYLAQLAHLLGLDPATAARIEQETAAKIDAQPESQ